MSASLLTVRDLHLTYAGGVQALAGVDLEIDTELVGLLGPNGAGKTTLLSVLARRLRPQHGSGRLRGLALEEPRNRLAWLRQVGYLPQEEGPPAHLSGREVVELALALARPGWSRRQRRHAAGEALERVGLTTAADRRAIGYSGGMRRRLGLARAMAPAPALLLVDEPTSGLDPEERVAFRDLLGSLADVSAVLISTHIAADVEVSCSRVLVLANGRVLWDGTPSALLTGCDGRVRTLSGDEQTAAEIGRNHRVTSLVRRGDELTVRYLVSAGEAAETPGEPCTATLEEAYLELIDRNGNDNDNGERQ